MSSGWTGGTSSDRPVTSSVWLQNIRISSWSFQPNTNFVGFRFKRRHGPAREFGWPSLAARAQVFCWPVLAPGVIARTGSNSMPTVFPVQKDENSSFCSECRFYLFVWQFELNRWTITGGIDSEFSVDNTVYSLHIIRLKLSKDVPGAHWVLYGSWHDPALPAVNRARRAWPRLARPVPAVMSKRCESNWERSGWPLPWSPTLWSLDQLVKSVIPLERYGVFRAD